MEIDCFHLLDALQALLKNETPHSAEEAGGGFNSFLKNDLQEKERKFLLAVSKIIDSNQYTEEELNMLCQTLAFHSKQISKYNNAI